MASDYSLDTNDSSIITGVTVYWKDNTCYMSMLILVWSRNMEVFAVIIVRQQYRWSDYGWNFSCEKYVWFTDPAIYRHTSYSKIEETLKKKVVKPKKK